MPKLTARARSRIPAKDFALGKGRYPIEDASHARNALARVSQHGTAAEKATVRAKVYEKYPGMGEDNGMKNEHKEHEGKKDHEGKKEHEGGEKHKKKAEAKSEGGRNHHGNFTAKHHNAITSH